MILIQLLEQMYWGNTINNYIWCAGIILFGIIFKRLFSKIISKLLFKLFKQFAGKDAAGKFVELLVKPIELLLLFTAFYIGINHLQHPLNKQIFHRTIVVEQISPTKPITITPAPEKQKDSVFQTYATPHVNTYADLIDKVFELLAIATFIWILLRIADFMAYVLLKKAEENDSKAAIQLVPFTRELIKIIVGAFGFFVIMSVVFNLNVGLIVSGLGIGGLALALAGKETVENLFGAFTIFIDKPFVVGDLVNVGGVEGTIEKVGFRSTRIRTNEKSLVSMPNKKMVDNPMDNLTLKTHRRIKYLLGLSYSTSEKQMKGIIKDIQTYFDENPKVSEDSLVAFDSFGESSLNVMIVYFIEMQPYADHVKLKEEITYKILDIVNSYKAEIAFPTRRVLHETVEGASSTQTYVD